MSVAFCILTLVKIRLLSLVFLFYIFPNTLYPKIGFELFERIFRCCYIFDY